MTWQGAIEADRAHLTQRVALTSPRALGEVLSSHTAYTVNALNQYVRLERAGPESSTEVVLRSHDANGNLLTDGERTFVYDVKNRLTDVFRAADGAPIAHYEYDALGRRVRKVVFSEAAPGQVEKETRFFYDGWRVVEEQNAAGQTEVTYVYSPVYIDEPVQIQRTAAHPLGAATLYLHQNARADVVAVTDAAGRVVERRTFDDFGRSFEWPYKREVQGSAVGNPFGFQGRRLDSETGLYYFRARTYDPGTGRFLQRDPVWDPGNVGNAYTFVGNGPASLRDPLGLDPWYWGEGEWRDHYREQQDRIDEQRRNPSLSADEQKSLHLQWQAYHHLLSGGDPGLASDHSISLLIVGGAGGAGRAVGSAVGSAATSAYNAAMRGLVGISAWLGGGGEAATAGAAAAGAGTTGAAVQRFAVAVQGSGTSATLYANNQIVGHASVTNGVMRASVELRSVVPLGQGYGRELLMKAMDHFRSQGQNVTGFQARWSSGLPSNFRAFLDALGGRTGCDALADAASKTPTGRWLTRMGFEVLKVRMKGRGERMEVLVDFAKKSGSQ